MRHGILDLGGSEPWLVLPKDPGPSPCSTTSQVYRRLLNNFRRRRSLASSRCCKVITKEPTPHIGLCWPSISVGHRRSAIDATSATTAPFAARHKQMPTSTLLLQHRGQLTTSILPSSANASNLDHTRPLPRDSGFLGRCWSRSALEGVSGRK
jgi:hypothetical protein